MTVDSRKWNKEDARIAVKNMLDELYDKDVQPDPDIPVWRSTPPAEAQIIT